jgi:ATP-dependent protease HslVU (ClpYQ) peptidase subunit
MSVVVAIKHNNKIYIGADSQVTRGGSRTTLKNPNNYKIWKVEDTNNCIMGHVGYLRHANVVRLMRNLVDDYDTYLDRVDYRFVVKYVVPEIIKTLKESHFLKVSDNYVDNMESSFIFAYRDKLFVIGADCSVIEVDDYCAIGSGSLEAIGSLISTEGEDIKSRIVKAIRASAASDIYVDYPIILTDTAKTEFEIITEDNEDKYLKKGKKKNEIQQK